jgi:hypothetical protein
METDSKEIDFIQSNLTSAKNVYLKGGNVVMEFADRKYRMGFDHKRVPILLDNDNNNENNNSNDNNNIKIGFVDTKPPVNIDMVKNLRVIDKFSTTVYNKYTSKSGNTKYRTNLEVVIRNFIKG